MSNKKRPVTRNWGRRLSWDGFVARKAVELMEQAVTNHRPFFVAAGFRRPHAPYIASDNQRDDPFEYANLASAATSAPIVADLKRLLREGWKGALP